MAVKERARKLANEFVTWAATDTPMDDLAEQHISLVIEQALLAERRLAMEEAAKIATGRVKHQFYENCAECDHVRKVISDLRAAAEKEVVK